MPRLPASALCRCGCAQIRNTPLHYAAWNGAVACVALLVERGANKEAKNEVRCTAFPPTAAAAACCIGTTAPTQRCALEKLDVRGAR
jgi:ankyrin repeat protein